VKARVVSWLRDSFWVVPSLFAASAALLGFALTNFEQRITDTVALPIFFSGGPEGARAVLSAILSSLITFTGLVFSITIVVLQLTSSQFSPRVLRAFLADMTIKVSLGVFVATFVYAMFVLRAVRGTASTESFVPQLAMTVAFLLVLVSIAVFIRYIDHIAQSIRAVNIIERIALATHGTIERRYDSDPAGPSTATDDAPPGSPRTICVRRAGVVVGIDTQKMLRLAEDSGSTVVVLRARGEFVPDAAPMLEVHGEDADDDALLDAIQLDRERSQQQDVAFGFRQLVDIAERALSPGINDPTTALQCVDQLHDLTRRLAVRELPSGRYAGRDGRLALVVPEARFEDFLFLAVDEIARWGSDAERIQNRLQAMLLDLLVAAHPEYRPSIQEQLRRFDPPRAPRPDAEGRGDLTPTDSGLR
jgi:uncharacterized membrane protein